MTMSKTLLLASAAVAATVMMGNAADAAGLFDWSGLYVGAHAGYLNGKVEPERG